jgi:hypothetical protein
LGKRLKINQLESFEKRLLAHLSDKLSFGLRACKSRHFEKKKNHLIERGGISFVGFPFRTL